jgi:hypothetical protein
MRYASPSIGEISWRALQEQLGKPTKVKYNNYFSGQYRWELYDVVPGTVEKSCRNHERLERKTKYKKWRQNLDR